MATFIQIVAQVWKASESRFLQQIGSKLAKLTMAAVAAMSLQVAFAQAQEAEFNIPAQELASAVQSFAAQSKLQVLYAPEITEGLSSQTVNGSLDTRQALETLLSGTGVIFQFTDENTVTLERGVVQPEERPVQLGTVTVLGSREPDVPLSNVPASITVVEREEIQQEQATTNRVEDILRRTVPGFNPTNNGVRNIRGRTAQVFINGVPTNEALRASSGSDLNLISPDQLGGIEVSRGASSAYGFGAPGGIIALTTPRAQSEELTLETRLRGSFNPQHANDSYQTSIYQSASQIIGDFDYHVGGFIGHDGLEYDPDGDLALGFDNAALLTNGKENIGNLDGSFGFDVGDYGALRLSGTFGYVDVREAFDIEPGVYREEFGRLIEQPEGGDSFRRSYTLNLSYENDDIWGSAVKLEALSSDIETQVFRTDDGLAVRDEQFNEYQGFRSSITSPLNAIHKGASITYGFDALRNRYFRPVFSEDTGEIEFFVSPDVTLDSYAGYGQLQVPVGDFILSAGARHEEYRGEVEAVSGGIAGGDIQDFDLTLYNAGAVYSLNDKIDVYATYSQGAEVTQLGRAARSAVTTEQIDPQPAKSNQYEIGLRSKSSSLSYALAAFYTESDLLSALQPDPDDPLNAPLIPLREPRKFWGIEGSVDWDINRKWGIGGVLTYQEGERELESGETRDIGSREIPPVLVTAYLDYSPYGWWRNTLQFNYRGERDPFGDSAEFGEGRVDDELLVNFAASFDLGPEEQLQFGVENLLNTEYVSIPGEADNFGFLYIPEEGTRISIAYSRKW